MDPEEIGEIDQFKRIADASEHLAKRGWLIAVLFIALLLLQLLLLLPVGAIRVY